MDMAGCDKLLFSASQHQQPEALSDYHQVATTHSQTHHTPFANTREYAVIRAQVGIHMHAHAHTLH